MRFATMFGALLMAQACFGQFGRDNAVSFRPRFNSLEAGAPRGQCAIRVRVDDEVELTFDRDQVLVRTLRGRPAQDAGSECSNPLPPRGVADFDFRQTDGPGRAEVVRRPDGGDGRLVVHISDPPSGDHKYTLEFRWSADLRGGRDGDRPRDFDRGRDRDEGNRFTMERAIALCRDGVRDRAIRDYGYRDFDIVESRADDGPGRHDFIIGRGVGRGRGRDRDGREEFRFVCRVDFGTARLQDVDLRRADRR